MVKRMRKIALIFASVLTGIVLVVLIALLCVMAMADHEKTDVSYASSVFYIYEINDHSKTKRRYFEEFLK